MREIEFRGKLYNSMWSYGNLRVTKDGVYTISPDNTPVGIYGRVIPNTVGQYTGLKDKNDTKIYEGDILQAADPSDRLTFIVTWYKENAAFNIMGINPPAFVVIGNIHDNPELMEVNHDR